jgi:hypothetical protein
VAQEPCWAAAHASPSNPCRRTPLPMATGRGSEGEHRLRAGGSCQAAGAQQGRARPAAQGGGRGLQ